MYRPLLGRKRLDRIEARYGKKLTVRIDPLRTSAELTILLYGLRARS